ncbi:hypothetical protein L7F22_029412 [Adiantum nelumboides]|nr:hypothetical protein [Adiantum nelumboides]
MPRMSGQGAAQDRQGEGRSNKTDAPSSVARLTINAITPPAARRGHRRRNEGLVFCSAIRSPGMEEEIVPCNHTRELKQLGEPTRLELSELAKCKKCDLNSNLWLCLTCGNLGCGRAQFGGVGGNSHGLTHFEETGHPISVKQGTITAEGTADIYCYACNDARIDPELASHLKHFGMNVMDLSKTEKSMTELQLEQNLKFDFNMTGDDGKELEPVYGPGLTGLRNLGNSCYMASVLQALFSLPSFQSRYFQAYRPHTMACTNPLPASCFECQMTKMADGLLSGRYSVPRRRPDGNESSDGPIFQEGIRPSMFMALVGKGHEEFSTMRQQDADEFLKHLISFIQRENRKMENNAAVGAPTSDPTKTLGFALQQRLQCTECKKVRYTVEPQDAGLSLPVPLRIKAKKEDAQQGDGDAKQKAPAEGVHAEQDTTASAADEVEYEGVDLRECLDIFTAPESLEYKCPSCNRNVIATKQTLFATFPDVLAIQVRRFQLVNWVPQKVNVPILVPVIGQDLSLDRYLGTGKRNDEEELPDTSPDEGQGNASKSVEFDAGAMSQLTAMGFPEVRCQRALLATGNTGDAEAAMNWLFAHMEDPDIDDPIDLAQAASAASGSGQAAGPDTSMLEEMGFTKAQATKALRLNSNNAEMAVAWLFENADDQGDVDGPASTAADNEAGPSAEQQQAVVPGSANLPATYKLSAFISHKGPSVHSGHYVAHVRKTGVVGKDNATEDGDDQEGWIFFK